jgi:transcriptional regulator with XRE-family HTH domain
VKNVIGPAIKSLRKEKGMTQKELSEITGFSQNTISNHENQNRSITEKDISVYSKALGVSPQHLFDLISNEQSSMTTDFLTKKANQIFSKLSNDSKKSVIKFSQNLYEQEQASKNESSEPFTLAAHSDDLKRKVTKNDLDNINSVLDEIDRKYDKK